MMSTMMSKRSLAIFLLSAFSFLACQKVSSTSAPKLDPKASISSDKLKLPSPLATPEPGSYLEAQLVTLSSATAGATIYYTTDGSTPTVSSSIYSVPISVEVSQTIKAFALKSDFLDSDLASFEYRIQGTVVPPSFSVPEGAYGSSQLVTLTSATPGATIYYTTDGSEPTTSSERYVNQLTVSSSQTIKAVAVFSDWIPSLVSVATYTINGAVAKPTASPAAGIFSSGQSVTLSSETADSVIYYTTDDSDPATSITRQIYSQAIDVPSSIVIKAIATKEKFSDSEPATFSYDVFLQPVISFSSADLKLKKGTNAQLTSLSSGGPITECTAEPVLPAGLSVGATDCSISGVPTYGGASVSYTITPKNPAVNGGAVNLTITIDGEDASGAFYINGNLVEGYQDVDSEIGLASGYYKAGIRHPGLDSSGTGFSTRDNKYYIEGVETPLDENGSGDFAGRRYLAGQFFTGLANGVCYVEGVSTSLVSEGKGFCDGKYYISSLDHPGLDSSGTGYSSRDQKYYVNGNLADGFVDDKTALLMHMDGDFTDASPNALGVTPIGGVSASSAEFKYGSGSARLEGDSSWVQTPPEASISGSQDFTAESWVKPDNIYPGSGYTMIWGAPQSNVGAFMFGYVTGGFVFWGRAWINVDYVATAQPLQAGVWSHVAVSRQGDTIRIFVNGVLAGSSQSDFSFTPATMQIGGDNGGNSWYAGFLDDFRITKGLARYTTSFTPPQTAFASLPKGFYKDGVLLPGLDSAGTGVNSLDSKYYVSGELANGLIVDDKTVLLMHMDGQDGSRTFTDSSQSPRVTTAQGDARINTNQSRFGGASAYFDGSGDLVSAESNTSFTFANEDFTVEFWFKDEGGGWERALVTTADPADSEGVWIGLQGSSLYWLFGANENWSFYKVSAPIDTAQWHHLALTRSGDIGRLFIDGVLLDSVEDSTILTNINNSLRIGGRDIWSQYFTGYIDEVRITKGLARYTSNFTPPTSAFPSPYSCFLNGANSGELNAAGTGWCSGSNKYYIDGVETGLSQGGDGSFAGRRYVGGHVFSGFDDGVCYLEGLSTNFVENGKGPCGEKYYIGGIHQPGLDSSGTGYSSRDQKYYIGGSLADGFVDDKTVLLLHMDGANDSKSFVDSSTSGFSFLSTGEAQLSTSYSRFGMASGYFDGSINSVVSKSSTSFGFNEDFSVEAWIKRTGNGTNSFDSYFAPIASASTSDDASGWIFYVHDGNNLGFLATESGGWSTIAYFGAELPLNEWHHVAAVRSSNTVRLYVNGFEIGSAPSSHPIASGSDVYVGSYPAINSSTPASFQGYIDELRITKGLARYTSSFTPPQSAFGTVPSGYYKDGVLLPGLDYAGTGTNSLNGKYYVNGSLANGLIVDDKTVLLMHMDGANGSRMFTDSSPQNHSITAHGDASIATAESKYGGSSVYFDGGSFLKVPDADSFDLSNSPFMIEAWFRANSLGSDWQTIIQKGWYGSNYSWSILVNSGNIGVFTHDINGDWNFTVSDLNISAGQWNHVALVYTGSEQRIFLNGVQVGAKTAIITNASGDVTIGASNSNNPGDYFNGFIDELRMTKGLASYSCFFNGTDTGSLNSDGTGWCSGSNKYYVLGAETGLSQSGDGNYAGRRYVAGEIYSGFDDGVCYVEGLSTNLVENGKGPCGEKYYIGGIHQPGLDSSGGGKNTLDNKYYVNGSIANGYVDDKTALLLALDGPTDLVDSSAYGRGISAYGSAQLSQQQARFGSGSAYFDGSYGSAIQVPMDSSLSFGSGDFTIEFWMYPTDVDSGYLGLFGQEDFNYLALQLNEECASSPRKFSFWMDSDGYPGWDYGDGCGKVSTSEVKLNKWQHVAMVRSGSTVRLFKDGVEEWNDTYEGQIFSNLNVPFYIGRSQLPWRVFKGFIDEFRVTNGVARYTSNFNPPQSAFATVKKGYYIDGVLQPGLDSTGTGFNVLDGNKFYSSGSLFTGFLEDKTVLLMHMDDTTLSDMSNSEHQVSVIGDVFTTSDSKFGGGSSFFGYGKRLAIDTHANFGMSTGDFTIEFWAKPTGLAAFNTILNLNTYQEGILLRPGIASDSLYLAGEHRDWNSPMNLQQGQWSHVALVRAAGNVKMFTNGQMILEWERGVDLGSAASVTLGASAHNFGETFEGYVDELRITKGIALYNDNFSPPGTAFTTSAGVYYIGGVPQPGLDSTGTGLNALDGKNYVNGNPVD